MDELKVADDVRATLAAAREEDGQLTEAGWPRPRHNGWPIPWLSPKDNLAVTDSAREAACASGAVCAVCGLGFQADETALLLVNPPQGPNVGRFMPGDVISPADGGVITSIDNGVMHRRCTRLALAYCPKLVELLEADDLVVVEVIAHNSVPQFLDLTDSGEPTLRATYDEGLVVEVPL